MSRIVLRRLTALARPLRDFAEVEIPAPRWLVRLFEDIGAGFAAGIAITWPLLPACVLGFVLLAFVR